MTHRLMTVGDGGERNGSKGASVEQVCGTEWPLSPCESIKSVPSTGRLQQHVDWFMWGVRVKDKPGVPAEEGRATKSGLCGYTPYHPTSPRFIIIITTTTTTMRGSSAECPGTK